jgi:hypothetical protein
MDPSKEKIAPELAEDSMGGEFSILPSQTSRIVV